MEEEMTKLTKDEVEKDIKTAEEVERLEGETQKTEKEELKYRESEKAKQGAELKAPGLEKVDLENEESKELELEKTEAEKETSQVSELEKVETEEEASKESKPKKAKIKPEKKETASNTGSDEEGVIKKSHRKARIAASAFAIIVLIALGYIYGRGVYYYKRNFFPQYTLGS